MYVVLFCAGTVNTFIPMMINYLWLFHTIAIFWNVWFPIRARHFDVHGYTKYMHIVVVVIAFTLSVIPVGVAFGTGGYVISSLIPSLSFCVMRSLAVNYYALVLPICIVFPFGITFNLLTVWKLLRMRQHSKQVASKLYNVNKPVWLHLPYF